MRTDADAIRQSLSDPEAFGQIFDRHFDAVHAYLARRIDRDVADDLAAQVFRVAFEQRQRFDLGIPHALPWLYGIAANLVRRHRRGESRRFRAYARASAARNSTDDAFGFTEARVDAAAVRPALARALASLREDERDVLLLHTWEELSYADIGRALDIPVGTVRSRLSRCRARLRELLSVDGQSPIDNATAESEEHG